MTWLEGEPFEAVRTWPERDRRQAARALLRLFLTSGFAWRFLHADPHPGNYRFLRDGNGVRVGVLDFGCVVPLEEDRAQSLVRLVQGASSSSVDQRPGGLSDAGVQPGPAGANGPLAPRAQPGRVRAVRTEGPFSLSDWRLSERVESLLGPFRWNFRFAGPAGLIFVVRAYLGLIRYMQALRVDLDWSEVWRSSVGPGRPQPPARPAAQARRARPAAARCCRATCAWPSGRRARSALT